MKNCIYETPVESEENMVARGMASTDVGLPSTDERVYKYMVRRNSKGVEFDGRHIEPFS